jgi:polysaccharide deacetylase family protein (PEP-CTERM system associated)
LKGEARRSTAEGRLPHRDVPPPPSVTDLVTNALSVDLEEYYHGMEFEAAVPLQSRSSLPSRIEGNLDELLDLFETRGVLATFFVVGQVAEAHTGMVRRLAAAGHEVACHSYRHELVHRQDPEDFRADVRRTKRLLEDQAGEEVVGYRAPNYSIGKAQEWAFDVLLEEGFRYDSSVYPIRHDRYGFPRAPRFPFEMRRKGPRGLMEFPIGTVRLLGLNLPIGGGGYFRLLPLPLTRLGIRHVNRGERQPIMFYLHPWEIDPEQPRPAMPLSHRFRHYVGIHQEKAKLSRLLEDLRFGRARDVLGL